MGQELIASLTNRTEPSAKAQFTPPGCMLDAAALESSAVKGLVVSMYRLGFGANTFVTPMLGRSHPLLRRPLALQKSRGSHASVFSVKASVLLSPSVT